MCVSTSDLHFVNITLAALWGIVKKKDQELGEKSGRAKLIAGPRW